MGRARHIEVVRRIVEEGFNRADPSVAADVCADDFVNNVCVNGVPMGPAGLGDHITMIAAAYPDLDIHVTDVVADERRVCIMWVSQGTALGPYMGLDATGRRFRTAQLAFYRFRGDRVDEWRGTYDSLAIVRAVTGRDTGDQLLIDLDAGRRLDPWAAAAGRSEVPSITEAQVGELVRTAVESGQGPVSARFTLSVVARGTTRGPAALAERAAELRRSFGDIGSSLEVAVVDGNRVAIRWVLEGAHLGEHLGVRATGRPVRLVSSALLTFDGDELVEWREIFDDTGFVEQTKTMFLLTST